MKYKSLCFAVLVLFVPVLMAQQDKVPAQNPPQLIDREVLFGNPEIADARLSPDGKYLSFKKPWSDTENVWVKKVDEPFSAARRLTAEKKRPIAGYLWSYDSKYVLYVKDHDGDENFNLYVVDPAGQPKQGADIQESRDLTGLKGVRAALYSVPKHDPDIVYIGLNDRDKAWHDLYKLRISTGERTLIRLNTEQIADWVFDLKGDLRLATRTLPNGDTEILRVDKDKFTRIYTCNVFEEASPVRFEKSGKRLYMVTNKGSDVDLASLVLLDPETGATETVESDPENRVDFGFAAFSDATDELVSTHYADDRWRHYFRDPGRKADHEWLSDRLKGYDFWTLGTLKDDVWLVTAYSDIEPGRTYLFDRNTHTLTFQFRVRERLPREALVEMKPVRYDSSDGLEIPAYVLLPMGVPAKGLPSLVIPHGGPWGRDFWGYNALAQFFANRGYAVIMPNFRGSTGYGKKFIDAGNLEWGRMMQADVTAGVKYMVEQGIADPKRVGIIGGSYGGYATLAGVAFTPDLYAAAVDIVGPSNLITLFHSIPPYWESFRKIMYARVGDPDTPEGKAELMERSPITSVDKIRTPLLVAQGANDPRVNRREAEQIVVALRDRGFPVEYLLAPDEGHGFARPVNNMALNMAAETFFAKHLGGRYQLGGTPATTTRLAEITVDPKSVVVTKMPDAPANGSQEH